MDIGMGVPTLGNGYRYFRDADLDAAGGSVPSDVLTEAEATLTSLAHVFFPVPSALPGPGSDPPDLEARHRTLLEQIPAVVFMAFLDGGGIGQAYVSPQIESMLGFAPRQWLEEQLQALG